MRKKKQARLADEAFWSNFFYFNIPDHINEIPAHVERVNFRYYSADDEGLLKMVEYVKSIGQLDLDGTDITNEGIKHLTQLENITEIRLKGCKQIDNNAMPDVCQIKGLELLHLINTAINTDGFEHIGQLTRLKTLLLSADENDPKLEEIYISLAPGCKMIVNYKSYPFLMW